MADEIRPSFAPARNDVDYAFWNTRLNDCLGQQEKIKHRLWRRLYNKRATGSKRWRNLQERKNLGGVEWRDRSSNAYRLTPNESSPSLFLTF